MYVCVHTYYGYYGNKNVLIQIPAGHHGTPEVAIKMIKKEYIDQDPKIRENLEREIDIMRLLSDCTYSVMLHNVIVSYYKYTLLNCVSTIYGNI